MTSAPAADDRHLAPDRLTGPPSVSQTGGCAYSPTDLEASQAVLVRHASQPTAAAAHQGFVAVADGASSSVHPDLAASLALDALERALDNPKAATVGAALALGARAGNEALQVRSALPSDPCDLRCSVAAAAYHHGSWTVMQSGSAVVYLSRGRTTGPVLRASERDAELGTPICAPTLHTFRAHPGDLVFVVAGGTSPCLQPGRAAVVLRNAPSLSDGCRALAESVAASYPRPHAVTALQAPARAPDRSAVLTALLAAALFLLAGAGLAYLAWSSGPSNPIIPPYARDQALFGVAADSSSARAEHAAAAPPSATDDAAVESQPGEPPLMSVPGVSDLEPEKELAARPNLDQVPPMGGATRNRPTGQLKIVGPVGTTIELRPAEQTGRPLTGQVREGGGGSFVFYKLPAQTTYLVTVWDSPSKKRVLLRDSRVFLGRGQAKMDVTAEHGRPGEP
jgi:hypothetical protein